MITYKLRFKITAVPMLGAVECGEVSVGTVQSLKPLDAVEVEYNLAKLIGCDQARLLKDQMVAVQKELENAA